MPNIGGAYVIKTTHREGQMRELLKKDVSSGIISTNMAERERIEKAVFEAIDELNEHLPKGSAVEKSAESTLYGKNGNLESLDFVEFIVEVETKIQNEFGVDFFLTDEDLLSKESSPFTTVGALTDHIEKVLEGNE
jgi:acyl carrier protein